MGAAGRDFHNFNMVFRNNKNYEVIAFTAAQIPGIEKRHYPKELSGRLYPNGVPIYSEERLVELIKRYKIDEIVLAYSDLSHEEVMHKASIVLANGPDFVLLGKETMLVSKKPVIAVTAVRTGCGKSQTARKVASLLKLMGKRVVVIRHPMPYGYLKEQIIERFEKYGDLARFKCTIEEREEYEPHLKVGNIVYAGVDYEKILKEAEKEADVIVWDGGNNDLPFIKPDLWVTVTDPHRAGHELKYYPGEINFRKADVIVINKVDSAPPGGLQLLRRNISIFNPKARVIEAKSPPTVDNPKLIKGKKVLVIEDGPTLTHGGMPYGIGAIVARRFKAKEIVDARKYAVGSIKNVYIKYPHLKRILPALGYSERQIKELEETINRAKADVVIDGTPTDLRRLLKVNKKIVMVSYKLEEVSKLKLADVVKDVKKKAQ